MPCGSARLTFPASRRPDLQELYSESRREEGCSRPGAGLMSLRQVLSVPDLGALTQSLKRTVRSELITAPSSQKTVGKESWLRAYCRLPGIQPSFLCEALFNQEMGYRGSRYKPFTYRPGLDFFKQQPAISGSISPATALKGLVLVALEIASKTISSKCQLVPPMLVTALLASSLTFFFPPPSFQGGLFPDTSFLCTVIICHATLNRRWL